MISKWFSVSWIASFLLTLFALGTPAGAKTINLTYCNFFPPIHFHVKICTERAKEIWKCTGEAATVAHFPVGVLFGTNGTCDGKPRALTEVGMSCYCCNRGRAPVMETIEFPPGHQTLSQLQR